MHGNRTWWELIMQSQLGCDRNQVVQNWMRKERKKERKNERKRGGKEGCCLGTEIEVRGLTW